MPAVAYYRPLLQPSPGCVNGWIAAKNLSSQPSRDRLEPLHNCRSGSLGDRQQRVGYNRPIHHDGRRLHDPQRPFTRRWLLFVIQRPLGLSASMPVDGQLRTISGTFRSLSEADIRRGRQFGSWYPHWRSKRVH